MSSDYPEQLWFTYIANSKKTSKLEVPVTRILSIVIPDYPPTGMLFGAERSFADLAENMIACGSDVYALEQLGLFNRNSNIYRIQQFEAKGGRFYLLKNTLGALRLAKQFNCDVIFAYHADHTNSVIPAYLASILTRKLLLVGVLDDRLVVEDELSIFRLLSYWRARERRFKHVLRRFVSSVIRRFACRNSICLTPTNHIAESYVRKFLRPRDVFVIGRGVNDVWFEPELHEVVKTYDACYSGRIDPEKGMFTLFSAWKMVVDKKPDAHLLIVGEAWPGLFPIYHKQIQELQISNNVTFAGYHSDEVSIRRMLRSSKIFILPSKLEGLSRAVLEAMASGLPCILGDIATAREIFGDTVLFVRVEDPLALSNAILNLLSDQQTRDEMSRRSVSLAKRHTWKEVAVRTLNIVNSAIPEREKKSFAG